MEALESPIAFSVTLGSIMARCTYPGFPIVPLALRNVTPEDMTFSPPQHDHPQRYQERRSSQKSPAEEPSVAEIGDEIHCGSDRRVLDTARILSAPSVKGALLE